MTYPVSFVKKTSEKYHPARTLNHESESGLWLNILPFDHPELIKEIIFTTKNTGESKRCHIGILPEGSAGLFPGMDQEKPFVYTGFEPIKDGIPINIELNRYPSIACSYYTKIIRDYFSSKADVIAPNFLKDTSYLFETKTQHTEDYKVYKGVTLRVQTDWQTNQPELLVTYDGLSYISTLNLTDITDVRNIDTRNLGKVLFRKKLYAFQTLPADATYHPEEAFPVLNNKLTRLLGIEIPVTRNIQKHAHITNTIKSFYAKYLNTDSFKSIIPHKSKWKTVEKELIQKFENNTNTLVFGEDHTGNEPYEGLKAWGPAVPGPHKHVKYFFIYALADEGALQKFYDHIRDSGQKGFLNLKTYTRLPLQYEQGLNICFDRCKNPVDMIRKKINAMRLDPACRYFAFYISPWTKFEADPGKWKIYYKLKEILLRRRMMMQALESEKISNGNVKYFISNIGASMIAKLGGVPWRLNQAVEDELIVGFGAFSSSKYNAKYVGSAFCFSNDGSFEDFDCFPAEDTHEIAGAAEMALLRYRKKHPDVKRMIVHFYKKISKKELQPLEQMLRKLNIDIPVIIVSINKTFSKDLIAFRQDKGGSMPPNGTFVRVGSQQYLLHINNRHSDDTYLEGTMPMPLKINIWASDRELFNHSHLTELLMKQVHNFCFMHWRSVKHSSIPVTVAYPEMLAGMVPWFDDEILPEEGNKTLWFL